MITVLSVTDMSCSQSTLAPFFLQRGNIHSLFDAGHCFVNNLFDMSVLPNTRVQLAPPSYQPVTLL